MITYTHNRMIFIHSSTIIKTGLVQVFTPDNNLIDEYELRNTVFASFKLPEIEGKYIIKVSVGLIEKRFEARVKNTEVNE